MRKILLVADGEELQDRRECQQWPVLSGVAGAFELGEGRVRTFQIAFINVRDDDDIVDPQCNWLMNMAPYWLVRLNDFLTWFNPALGFVAAILALLTIAAAAERFPRAAASSVIHRAPPVSVLASAECARLVVPPELRDLRLYD